MLDDPTTVPLSPFCWHRPTRRDTTVVPPATFVSRLRRRQDTKDNGMRKETFDVSCLTFQLGVTRFIPLVPAGITRYTSRDSTMRPRLVSIRRVTRRGFSESDSGVGQRRGNGCFIESTALASFCETKYYSHLHLDTAER